MRNFDFGTANEQQKEAIQATEGPVLITAGPGTGKTYTLVQRTLYLIEEKHVEPEQILLVTFTEKATRELITRLTNEFSKQNIKVNLNKMYIGTFHALCLRILKEHIEYTRLRKNFRLLDGFGQKYFLYEHIQEFREITDFDLVIQNEDHWSEEYRKYHQAELLTDAVNGIAETVDDPEKMISDSDPAVSALGKICQKYNKLLLAENYLDFSAIQRETIKLLTEHENVRKEIQNQISYLMIDEYQDTNYIQEKLVFLLAGEKQNICVVGDDDQALYRFRGATVMNLIHFADKFPAGKCRELYLSNNYRSNKDIVDFYNSWMQNTAWKDAKGKATGFHWNGFRKEKKIIPKNFQNLQSGSVIRLEAAKDENKKYQYENIVDFLHMLYASGKITDYNQVAFIFPALKNDFVEGLEEYLETNGISVNSPRSGKYFKRKEILQITGILLKLFPAYLKKLTDGAYDEIFRSSKKPKKGEKIDIKGSGQEHFQNAIDEAEKILNNPEYSALADWVDSVSHKIEDDEPTEDNYNFSQLYYQIISFNPFSDYLDVNMAEPLKDLRPARNLAKYSGIISQFEKEYKIKGLNKNSALSCAEKWFNKYYRWSRHDDNQEYEDNSEYAPSGCVSFYTIHQAKGMEFPVVITTAPAPHDLRKDSKSDTEKIAKKVAIKKYGNLDDSEPEDDIRYYDAWRKFYTAFSRAQNLLVILKKENLLGNIKEKYEELPFCTDPGFDINEFDFAPVKDVNLKPTFAFTSDVAAYDRCPRQYKFFKELGFSPVKNEGQNFGTLIHETIEDIHKAAIRGEKDTIREDNIRGWFSVNYHSLAQSEHLEMNDLQKEAALEEVMEYVHSHDGQWDKIIEAEVDVSKVKDEYIIKGAIDLIRGKEDSVEIIDFKSEKKPSSDKPHPYLEQYRKQLNVYADLLSKQKSYQISDMKLYFTGEVKDQDPTLSFQYDPAEVEDTMKHFDDTVKNIMEKNFDGVAADKSICDYCDFRSLCSVERKNKG